MNIPPEALGAESLAIRHLKTASDYRWGCIGKRGREERSRKHLEKARKLLRRAIQLVNAKVPT